jgi:hypothetical protein
MLQTGSIYAQAAETNCTVHSEHRSSSDAHAACGGAHPKLRLKGLSEEIVYAATIVKKQLDAR